MKRAVCVGLRALLEDPLRRQAFLGDRVTVLNFHRVSPDPSPFWPPVRPEHFEDLLSFVQDRFEVTTFRALRRGLRNHRKPALVLSFDDGFSDFLDFAFPLMERKGLPCNLNIIGRVIEEKKPLWNVELYDFLTQASPLALEQLKTLGLAGLPGAAALASERARYGVELSRQLKNMPSAQREARLAGLRTLMSSEIARRTPMLTERDIVDLARRGVEIGCHSYHHESMAWAPFEFFVSDFARCRALFARLELPLDIYAFPNGSFTFSQVDFLERAGVETILLVGEAYGHLGRSALHRFTAHGASAEELSWIALAGPAWTGRNWSFHLGELRRQAA